MSRWVPSRPQLVRQPVLTESDRQCLEVRPLAGRQRVHRLRERIAHQEPQHQPVALAGVGADPALGGTEGCGQPLGHLGVVGQDVAGQHPHRHQIHRPRRADPDQTRHPLAVPDPRQQPGGGHQRLPRPPVHHQAPPPAAQPPRDLLGEHLRPPPPPPHQYQPGHGAGGDDRPRRHTHPDVMHPHPERDRAGQQRTAPEPPGQPQHPGDHQPGDEPAQPDRDRGSPEVHRTPLDLHTPHPDHHRSPPSIPHLRVVVPLPRRALRPQPVLRAGRAVVTRSTTERARLGPLAAIRDAAVTDRRTATIDTIETIGTAELEDGDRLPTTRAPLTRYRSPRSHHHHHPALRSLARTRRPGRRDGHVLRGAHSGCAV
jgi:hypothetical protein